MLPVHMKEKKKGHNAGRVADDAVSACVTQQLTTFWYRTSRTSMEFCIIYAPGMDTEHGLVSMLRLNLVTS